ncbi:hypothetical protein OJF2_08060 [Aquisphaera giovannonii]|uniref:DUF1800 domain-containing protein n=2 Tax=Aquisphaera giovannonii TaxID=406548 RepID=A0A5B9VV72_9BACT|nr:hypothetical protein OJF2_08060 [Aquisphaera giovannonii]
MTTWEKDPAAAWEPYSPARDGAWDLARAAHLHRRAGFGATPGRVAHDAKAGHEAAIRAVLEGDPEGPGGRSRSEVEEIAAAMADSARRDPSLGRVRLAWIFRLLNNPHPLRERMTLAWHGHYATGARKVENPLAMLEQIEAMRSLWDAPISKLHRAMIDGAGLQIWLDGVDSDNEKPNENLGREFLELFALGEGSYSEADVKAAARALTGYRSENRDDLRKHVVFDPGRHDDGEKTLLGRTGRWGPADLVRIASAHPAAARRIARRLYVTFVDDVEPPPAALVAALADRIRTPGDVDVRQGIEVVLNSRLFHSEAVRGRRVKSAVDYAVGLIRSSGWRRPTPDPATIDVHLTRMGQTLLDPPSVAGWPGGLAWLGAPLLIARANFAAEVTAGQGVESHLRGPESEGRVSPAEWAAAVADSFLAGGRSRADDIRAASPKGRVEALRLVASFPEAHLA